MCEALVSTLAWLHLHTGREVMLGKKRKVNRGRRIEKELVEGE